MNVNVARKPLAAALDALTALAKECVAPINPPHAPINPPHARIVADDTGIRVVLTIMGALLRLDLPGEVKDEGEAFVSVKALAGAVKASSADTLRIEVLGAKVHVADSEATVKVNAEEKPEGVFELEIPTFSNSIPAANLLEMVSFCEKSISKDISRPNLMGMNFRTMHDATLRVASTNSHCLSRRRAPLQNDTEESFDFLLPSWGVPVLKKVLKGRKDGVSFGTFEAGNTPWNVIQGEGWSFTTHSNKEFPDISYFERVPSRVAKVECRALKGVKKAVKIVGKDRTATLAVENGKVTVEASDGDKITVEMNLKGAALADAKFGVNLSYLQDALATFGCDEVVVALDDALSPIYIFPEDEEHLAMQIIMPVRL